MDKGYNLHILQALFKDFLIAEKTSKITMKNYLSDVRHHLSWIAYRFSNLAKDTNVIENNDIGLIDQFIMFSEHNMISDYVSYLLENGVPVSTINRRLSTLRKFYHFCHIRGILHVNPTHSIRNVGSKVTDPELPRELTLRNNYEKYLQDNLNGENVVDFMSDFEELFSNKYDEN